MNWAGAKARYIAGRIRHVSPERILGFARQSRRLTPRTPLWMVVADMCASVVLYQTTFEHYAQWDYRILTGKERRTFMTEPKSATLSRAFNSQAKRVLFDDKVRFAEEFAADIGRAWLDLTAADPAAFADFLSLYAAVIAKDPVGVGGSGIELYRAEDVEDPATLYADLRASRHTLVEQVLVQHPDMARLYPGSVNTLRIVTYRDPEDEVHVLARVLKIGNGSFIDNYSGGGMYTMVDDEGVALHAAYDGAGTVFHRHPVTGETIEGFRVPLFGEVIALAERLARQIPEMPYIGWDVAITPERPVVIEGNHNTGVFQSRPAVTGIRTGLMPIYERAMRL